MDLGEGREGAQTEEQEKDRARKMDDGRVGALSIIYLFFTVPCPQKEARTR